MRRRSWARQSSGAIQYRIPKSGDSGYGFRLRAVLSAQRSLAARPRMINFKACVFYSGRLWQSQRFSAFQGRALERTAPKNVTLGAKGGYRLPVGCNRSVGRVQDRDDRRFHAVGRGGSAAIGLALVFGLQVDFADRVVT